MKKIILFIVISIVPCDIISKNEDEDLSEQIKIGNFALPTAQQVGPLFSIGQNILETNNLQLYGYFNHQRGEHTLLSQATPNVLYGLSDACSLFIGVPVTIKFKDCDIKTSGAQDFFVQTEYAFFDKTMHDASMQATALAAIIFPSGSGVNIKFPSVDERETSIRSNALSFLLGGTASYIGVRWYFFVSTGGLIVASRSRTKQGNQFLYQAGIGRNIGNPFGSIFNWMIEFNGTYSWRDKANDMLAKNSGGNTLYISPSLWFSTDRLIIQLGIGIPVVQHLFGNQNKNHFTLACNIGWRFT
jgi:hypothetical protein